MENLSIIMQKCKENTFQGIMFSTFNAELFILVFCSSTWGMKNGEAIFHDQSILWSFVLSYKIIACNQGSLEYILSKKVRLELHIALRYALDIAR